jgi:predicted negative regulator of RcsB-dependent stress response
MANQLDLEEQEQLDQIKHFWKQYGNQITWLLILVLGAFAAWNGYQYWQRSQALQASAMFDEVSRFARSNDPEKTERAFNDMKERFASTTFTYQAGLLAAKSLYESGKPDNARAVLTWVARQSDDAGYAAIAQLRLSAVLMEIKSYDEAIKALDAVIEPSFLALAADRRGDILLAQGKQAEAKEQYLKAYAAFEDETQYRRLVEVKLNALGVNPSGDASPTTAAKSEAAK